MPNSQKKFNFVIIGGGLIGLLTALILSKKGIKCCLIEKNKYLDNEKNSVFQPLSLNYRTILILKKFGLWNTSLVDTYPIYSLYVKYFHNLAKLKLSSTDLNIPFLGYVVDKKSLQEYFIKSARGSKNITIIDDVEVVKILRDEKQNEIIFKDNKAKQTHKIFCEYLILSDGSPNNLKKDLGFKYEHKDYSQISFMFNCSGNFEDNSAAQLFNNDGIFALIPYNKTKANLILTLKKKKISHFFDNDNKLNIEKIHGIFAKYLSNLKNEELIYKYDLKTSRSLNVISERIILLGNSSQLLHPIGAQGFNLGVRNIETIIDNSEELVLERKNYKRIQEIMKNIENILKIERNETFLLTDLSTTILSNSANITKLTSTIFINLLKRSKTAKKLLLKNILGLKDCSYLTIKKTS